eukprot:8027200-Karenia_brevis.AAC.1
MSETIQVAGISMHQTQLSQDDGLRRPVDPGGLEQRQQRAKREWGMRLTDKEWQAGLRGLVSLGNMLRAAGYEVTRTEEE